MARRERPNSKNFTATDVYSIFDKLSGTAMASFNRHAAQKAAAELKNDVKDEFIKRLPKANHPHVKRYKKDKTYSDVLLDAVRQGSNKTNNSDEEYGRSMVHVLGVRDSTSMTYIARFFEVGTKRDGKQVIKPLQYLKSASQGFEMKLSVEETLKSYIDKISK